MTANEIFGRTIQLFLVDGRPTGLRKATIHGWTGSIFVATTSTFASLAERTEVDRTGVYILFSPDPERQGETRVYIGSANSVRERIKQSAVQRESTYVSELIDEVRIRVKLRKNDGSVTFRELSEGEQQLLTVLGLLRFTAEEESPFLLDEPDTHLNPRWSVEYLQHIRNFLQVSDAKKQSSHVLLATHNPIAVAELEREQVQILKRDDETLSISATEPDTHPRGMGYAGVVTSEMFGLSAALDTYTQRLLSKKRRLSAKEDLSEEDRSDLGKINSELQTYGFRYEVRDPEVKRALQQSEEEFEGATVPEATPEHREKSLRLIQNALKKEGD